MSKDRAVRTQFQDPREQPGTESARTLVGIVSLGDLAVETGDEKQAGDVLERVSEPAQPQR